MLTFRDNPGQGLVEYGLLMVLVVVIVVVTVVLLSPLVTNLYRSVITNWPR